MDQRLSTPEDFKDADENKLNEMVLGIGLRQGGLDKLSTNIPQIANQGLKNLYRSFTLFGQKPTPDQVDKLKSYIQRNTASGAFGYNFNPDEANPGLAKLLRTGGTLQQKQFSGGMGSAPLQQKANMGMGTQFGAGRAKPYAKPKMNDAYGMMSSEVKRRVREKEERRRRARLIRDQAGDTVEQIGGKLYGSGGTLLGTMETGLGGVSVLNTNKSDLAQAQARAQKRIDELNKGNVRLGNPSMTAEEEDREYAKEGVSRVNGQFTYYK